MPWYGLFLYLIARFLNGCILPVVGSSDRVIAEQSAITAVVVCDRDESCDTRPANINLMVFADTGTVAEHYTSPDGGITTIQWNRCIVWNYRTADCYGAASIDPYVVYPNLALHIRPFAYQRTDSQAEQVVHAVIVPPKPGDR